MEKNQTFHPLTEKFYSKKSIILKLDIFRIENLKFYKLKALLLKKDALIIGV